jgi:NAD(P)-dependent dehydrogenase (short-subunit alcohol dehydrogenase family)
VIRVAVVTGGASRFGLGIVHKVVTDGHHVAILDRDTSPRWRRRPT